MSKDKTITDSQGSLESIDLRRKTKKEQKYILGQIQKKRQEELMYRRESLKFLMRLKESGQPVLLDPKDTALILYGNPNFENVVIA